MQVGDIRDRRGPAACPICGGGGQEYRFMHRGYPVFACSQCSGEYLHPQPGDDVLKEIYDEAYFLGERQGVDPQAVAQLKRATARLYLDQIERLHRGSDLSLLEIGCGTGDFLVEAKSRGMSVHGIEYATAAAMAANHKLGNSVVQTGSIEQVRLPEASLDVVAFCDVIEHVRCPKQFLSRVHSALKPGGFAFAVTPSLDSWSRKLMGKSWMEYKTEHLFYFGRKSLTRLFLSSGFEHVRFSSNYKILSFEYINAHFQRFRVPVWTPLLAVTGRLIPQSLRRRQVRIVASGVVALAYKGERESPDAK